MSEIDYLQQGRVPPKEIFPDFCFRNAYDSSKVFYSFLELDSDPYITTQGHYIEVYSKDAFVLDEKQFVDIDLTAQSENISLEDEFSMAVPAMTATAVVSSPNSPEHTKDAFAIIPEKKYEPVELKSDEEYMHIDRASPHFSPQIIEQADPGDIISAMLMYHQTHTEEDIEVKEVSSGSNTPPLASSPIEEEEDESEEDISIEPGTPLAVHFNLNLDEEEPRTIKPVITDVRPRAVPIDEKPMITLSLDTPETKKPVVKLTRGEILRRKALSNKKKVTSARSRKKYAHVGSRYLTSLLSVSPKKSTVKRAYARKSSASSKHIERMKRAQELKRAKEEKRKEEDLFSRVLPPVKRTSRKKKLKSVRRKGTTKDTVEKTPKKVKTLDFSIPDTPDPLIFDSISQHIIESRDPSPVAPTMSPVEKKLMDAKCIVNIYSMEEDLDEINRIRQEVRREYRETLENDCINLFDSIFSSVFLRIDTQNKIRMMKDERSKAFLLEGSSFTKGVTSGRPHVRHFRLSNSMEELIWYSGKKMKSIILSDISEINVGIWNFSDVRKLTDEFKFSITSAHKILDLATNDVELLEKFTRSLEHLIKIPIKFIDS
ncbi:hypothetical protein PCE1_002960 [Barthelona sp. PCE]